MAGIELLHAPLTGAMVIGLDHRIRTGAGRFPPSPSFPYDGWLVLYLPGTAEPLSYHASRADAETFLLKQLPAFRRHVGLQLVPDRHKSGFLGSITDTLEPWTWSENGKYKERLPDPDAQVRLHVQPFSGPWLDERVSQRQQRLRDDGLFHAVPTATEDAKTRQRHLAYFKAITLNSLNFTGMFIPPLGAVMLGVTAVQLLNETFEGIGSWLEGDRQQAFDYLMEVLENAAIMAALAAAHTGINRPVVERIPVETPSFIEELDPVELPDGALRLWRPDLAPFAHDKLLPAGLKPDEFGLFHHEGKTWLPVENRVYSVKRAAPGFGLEHPTRRHAYQPPALHNGAGAWLLETEHPLSWSTSRLLRRMGHLNTHFDEPTLQTALAVSDTDEDVLRRCLVHNKVLPALLQDTLVRFRLDQELRSTESPPHTLHDAFERRYEQTDSKHTVEGETLRRRYARLPAPIIDELLRHADRQTLKALTQGKIEPRLAEEVRAYQQQVRLTRAYEGLYLDAVRSWDADRLILHILGQIPEWPASLTLELEQHRYLPSDSMRLGNASAVPDVSILSTQVGYMVLDNTTANVAQGQVHGSLYDALAAVMPAPLRQALGETGVVPPLALKRLLQAKPLLARAELRQLLRMQPLRPGYRSPMRLADGRLGYPMGGGNRPGQYYRRPTFLRMINQLGLPRHTPHTADDILSALEASGLNGQQINQRLLDLGRERNELTRYLNDWRDAASAAAGSTEASNSLHSQLLQCWYDHAWRSQNSELPRLRLERITLDTFPTDLPASFGERVVCLELIAPSYYRNLDTQPRLRRLARLLTQFPNLRSLEISAPSDETAVVSAPMNTLRLISDNFPRLEALNLTNQRLILTTADFDRVRGMQQLRRLTLDGNVISPFCTEGFGALGLDYLSLEGMSLRHFPSSLTSRTLNRISEVSLRHNLIRSLPDFLIGNEQSTLPHTVLHLEGNDIFDSQLLSILISHEGIPERIHFDRSTALEVRMRRYSIAREQLHEATHSWANASSSTAPLSPAVVAMRNRISMALNTYWRGVEVGSQSPLRLDNIALEHFPARLPSFFHEHVRALSLTRISSTVEQLNAFFQPFSSVEALTCSNHAQPGQALASTLLNLPQLSALHLPEMGLVINNDMLAVFGQLNDLRTLDLTGNRLSGITHVPETLRNLRRLDLSDMDISQWPAWVERVLPLDLLDLSGNLLTELPEYILDNPDTDAQVTSIRLVDNPLSPETLERARRSSATQRRFTFAFSPTGDVPAGGHLHAPRPIEAEDRANLQRWLLGTQDQNEALRDAWQELKRAGDAHNLQALVGRLQQAAPFRNPETRQAFAERVRIMLIRAAVNQEDRALFNQIAQEALVQPETGEQTCHDGVARVFYDVESYIANQRLLTDYADSEQGLYQELRRLYRLERLSEIARTNAGERDEAEVCLAYRRGANGPLKLGIPKDDMLFEAVADVYPDELTRVIEQVLRDQRGEGFLMYAVNNEQWGRYLRSTYSDRFNAIEQAYQANVLDLPNHYPEEVRIEDLAGEYEALQRRKSEQDRQLIRELTLRANSDPI